MKLMPASRALATIRVDVASSVGPPNIMVPRHIGEILRPLRPSWRYSIGGALEIGRNKNQHHSAWTPSLRANGSRECAPDDRFREAIQSKEKRVDCFVAAPRNDG